MNKLYNDLKINLISGMRLASFQRCAPDDFRFNFDQLALLLTLDLALEITSDFVLNLPEPEFNRYALPVYAFSLLCFFLAAHFSGKLARNETLLLQIGVMVYSFTPLPGLLQLLITSASRLTPSDDPGTGNWLYRLFSIYAMLLLLRVLYLTTGRLKIATAAAFILMMFAVTIPQKYFAEDDEFWYTADADENSNDDLSGQQDPYAAYRALDAEKLLYQQTAILDRVLNKLTPQRHNISDLFFVGFAGDAHQDVFFKEVSYAKRLFDERFDTRGHSLNLINHLQTAETLPLATATNLRLALKRIGELMNAEEDVLVLYLTSHGSQTHELTVDFWPMALNAITPETLNAMLDEAGIKWRVVIISACYSGGFIAALQKPDTVVATASASDRSSFGCDNKSEFTYYGEAIFKDQLQRHHSLLTALQQAKISINEREQREQLEPSLPQLSIGAAIAPKLQRLSMEIRSRQCYSGNVPDKHQLSSLCRRNGTSGSASQD